MIEWIWDVLTVGSNFFSYKAGQRFKAFGVFSILLILAGSLISGGLIRADLASGMGIPMLVSGVVLLLVCMVGWNNSAPRPAE